MKPLIICHMASSIDGRILPARWAPHGAHSPAIWEDLHRRMGGGSWLVGRVTGQEFAKRDAYPAQPHVTFPRTAWLPDRTAAAYGIVLDGHGKIAWGRSDVGGDPIIVVLTRKVTDGHLAGLRDDGVGYVFAGDAELDLDEVALVIVAKLRIDRLLLDDGGFLRTGLIDEISLTLVLAIDGISGAPATFDGPEAATAARLPIHNLALIGNEVLDGGVVWLWYRITRD